jgi:benzoyl-CoA reductase/2-hydroxyglutaryl-CoA dehydratase subunit BcrC/BadD/HgdB
VKEEVKPLQTNVSPKALQTFSEAAQTIVNPEVQKWKGQGGKIMGYFCAAMPVEMITATGLLPFRVRATGSTSTELSDAYLANINCSFPRHAFNMALKGEYDFLDGLVFFNSCDHIRRVYDHWIRRVKTPFVKILSLPRQDQPAQVKWFRDELAILRQGMQEHFRVEITDDGLREAIALHNTLRRRQRELYMLRKKDNPPITGAEMLTVTVAGTAMPPAQYGRLLGELLEHLGKRAGHSGHRARLMLIGGEMDNPDYIEVIEGQGGLVVTDSLCFGSRLIWKDVDEGVKDPLTALAQYYVADRPSCPRVYTRFGARMDYARKMIQDFKVDGVVFVRLTMCELWGFEQYTASHDSQGWGVPVLFMDRDYAQTSIGQLRTRVQAFLETLEARHG